MGSKVRRRSEGAQEQPAGGKQEVRKEEMGRERRRKERGQQEARGERWRWYGWDEREEKKRRRR